jgi:hypothetical protein
MRKAQHTQDVKLCIVSRAQVVVCSVLGVPGQPGACCVCCLVSRVQLHTCAMCTLRNVLCAVQGICTKHSIGKSLYVQFTRKSTLHCAGCSVFLGQYALCTSYVVYSNQCAMCVQQARCAMLIAQMSCDLLCAECFSALLALYTNSAQYPDSVQCACSKQGGHCYVCSVCIVQMSCVCRVFLCPGCLVHKLCTAPHPCAMFVYTPCRVCNARCAQ